MKPEKFYGNPALGIWRLCKLRYYPSQLEIRGRLPNKAKEIDWQERTYKGKTVLWPCMSGMPLTYTEE